MKLGVAYSSNGEIIFNAQTGDVIKATCNTNDGFFDRIKRFDVEEFKREYGCLPSNEIDILDIGYWYESDGEFGYESPCADWRREIAMSA